MYLLKTRKITTDGIPGQSDNGYFLLEPGAAQTVGRRSEQQDMFLQRALPESDSFLAAVADGMGGLSSGGAAAKLVLDAVSAELEEKLSRDMEPEQIAGLLVLATEKAGKKLVHWCMEQRVSAGTTLAVALIFKKELYFCSVGDSRLYLLRSGELFQINEDHSLENYLIRCKMRREEVPELSGSLYSYLGQEPVAEIDFSRKGLALLADDVLLLCTDGFYQAVSEEEISGTLWEKSMQKQTESMLKLVLKKKIEHQDNATLVTLRCHER